MFKQPRLAAAAAGMAAWQAWQPSKLLLLVPLHSASSCPCRVELHAEYVHHLFSP